MNQTNMLVIALFIFSSEIGNKDTLWESCQMLHKKPYCGWLEYARFYATTTGSMAAHRCDAHPAPCMAQDFINQRGKRAAQLLKYSAKWHKFRQIFNLDC